MKVGGFLFSWCVTQSINQEKQTPKVKTLIVLALLAASIIGALAQAERTTMPQRAPTQNEQK